MATVKICDDPKCSHIGNKKRHSKVERTEIIIKRDGGEIQLGHDQCDVCYLASLSEIRKRFPKSGETA